MESQQPYRPPRASTAQRPAPGTGGVISPLMIEHLDKTRPWVLFLGILGMIGTAFLIMGGLLMLVMGSALGMQDDSNPFGAAVGPFLGGFYLLGAVFYFFPSLFLLRYSGAIRNIGGRANTAGFEDALKNQRSFWRFTGIAAAAFIGLYVLIIIGAIVVGVMGGLAGA